TAEEGISERRFTVSPSDLGVTALAWSRDDRNLVIGRSDGAVQILDLTATTQQVAQAASNEKPEIVARTIVPHRNSWVCRSIAISPDSSVIAVAENVPGKPRIQLFANQFEGQPPRTDIQNETLTERRNGHKLRINDLAFTHDGKYLVSCSDDGTLKFWLFSTRLNAFGE
ncbi:MAG: WD40 repeat domain-containing protein, partial [Planctomycetota bacterium]